MELLHGNEQSCCYSATPTSEEDSSVDNLTRGPWSAEEDVVLMNYIAAHVEGRWNSLAHRAGLKRTGKSCRLRWLNYLRPDLRRGDITPEEQLLILELHSRWGNRWSKIAQHLPGRTDNEIKNYWRTRVQKHAKQLKCEVNSQQFKDIVRHVWIPRLVERIQADSGGAHVGSETCTSLPDVTPPASQPSDYSVSDFATAGMDPAQEISSSLPAGSSSDSLGTQFFWSPTPAFDGEATAAAATVDPLDGNWAEILSNFGECADTSLPNFDFAGDWAGENLWSGLDDNIWLQQPQFY